MASACRRLRRKQSILRLLMGAYDSAVVWLKEQCRGKEFEMLKPGKYAVRFPEKPPRPAWNRYLYRAYFNGHHLLVCWLPSVLRNAHCAATAHTSSITHARVRSIRLFVRCLGRLAVSGTRCVGSRSWRSIRTSLALKLRQLEYRARHEHLGMNCTQCSRPAVVQLKGHPLCAEHAAMVSKVQDAQNDNVRLLMAMIADDENAIDASFGLAPRRPMQILLGRLCERSIQP